MASPTVLAHLGAWSQLIPPIAAIARRSRVSAHRWVAAGCFISVAGDVAMLMMGMRGINNHWVAYASTPLTGAAFLWGLSFWQVSLVERLAVRLTIPSYIAAWVLLALLTEDTRSFSRFASPFHALVLLATALWTVVRHWLGSAERSLLNADWFWIGGGLAVYGAATLTFGPVAAALVASRPDLAIAMIELKAVFSLVAFVAIAWGIWCWRPAKVSGFSASVSRSR